MIARRLNGDGDGSRGAWIGILSQEGVRALRRGGHAAVAGACAPDLAAERVRFVDPARQAELEGAPADRLAELVAAPFPARPAVIADVARGPDDVTLQLRIQPDLACLRGHFPELPIVPGAIQLGWALAFAALHLGHDSRMRALKAVKFERIIQPGQAIRLCIEVDRSAGEVAFEYSSDMGRHSRGRIGTGGADD